MNTAFDLEFDPEPGLWVARGLEATLAASLLLAVAAALALIPRRASAAWRHAS